MRIATQKRDKEILKRLWQGKAPKEVAYEMRLSSVWVAYDAIRRLDKRQSNFTKYKKSKFHRE